MTVVLSSFFGVALVAWLTWRGLKPFLKVRSMQDFAQTYNAQDGKLQGALAITEFGAKKAARENFDSVTHGASIGLRLLATVLAPLVFFVGNDMLLDASGTSIPSDLAPWLGLALLGAVLWYLLYIWTYALEITTNEIHIPTPMLFRRRYDLRDVESVVDMGAYFLKVRFRGGRQAEVLKYVAGREKMLDRLSRSVPGNAEETCQSFQKSKQSAVA